MQRIRQQVEQKRGLPWRQRCPSRPSNDRVLERIWRVHCCVLMRQTANEDGLMICFGNATPPHTPLRDGTLALTPSKAPFRLDALQRVSVKSAHAIVALVYNFFRYCRFVFLFSVGGHHGDWPRWKH